MNKKLIGQRIRDLRELSGRTLTAVAHTAGILKSTLSKIEKGQISSPITTLIRIAHALRLPVAEFFEEQAKNPLYELTRKGKGRLTMRDGGYRYEALASRIRHKVAEPFLLTAAKPEAPRGEFKHNGEEFLYVLSGRIQFKLGNETLMLKQGDSLYFNPKLRHYTKIVGKSPTRILCIFIQRPQIASRRQRKPS
jgi:transcriptional regulator with XRE-family HTH domain